MPLPPGSRLGPYEILSAIGAGGMGEVYRARDTRLARSVAIKVLPATTMALDSQSRARFEREALTASALNHPNILTVFDVGREAGIDYLVTELVDGVTLRARLENGPLPIREIVDFGAQIADGLAAAHAAGLVHRDVKPDNVMVTRDGRIKILDFGLAKPRHDDAATDQTRVEISQAGVLVGTVDYMAPEQVRGDAVDSRADLFGLGVVLYEMATGQRPFHGASTIETLNAILKEAPLWVPTAPVALRQIVEHCLDKDPRHRFQSAEDIAFALRAFGGATLETGPEALPPVALGARRRTWIFGLALVTCAALIAFAWASERFGTPPMANEGAIQFEISTPPGGTPPETPQFAISPDGTAVVFVATVENISSLWLRRLRSSQVEKLARTEGAAFPFWSPDSQFVAFFSGGVLRTIQLASGQIQAVSPAANARGGTWGANDQILFAVPNEGVSLVRAIASGEVRVVTRLNRSMDETAHLHPLMLPDGEHFFFVVRSRRPQNAGVFIGALKGDPPRRLLDADSQVTYVSGRVIYGREIGAENLRFQSPWRNALVTRASLFVQGFDLDKLALSGDPVRLPDEVGYSGQISASAFSISSNGILVYQPPDVPAKTELRWLDRAGKVLSVVQANTFYPHPRLSTDGSQLALSILDPELGTPDVWTIDLATGRRTRMTFDPGVDFDAVWSPDAQQLAFASDRNGSHEIYVANANSPSTVRQLTSAGGYNYPTDWSPDGKYVVYQGATVSGTALFAVPASGGEPVALAKGPLGESSGSVSPTGEWIAFTSRSARDSRDVFLQTFPDGIHRSQISSNGGTDPRWNQGGGEIFFLADDYTKLYSAKLRRTTVFTAETPKVVMNLQLWKGPPTAIHYFDVAPSGDRFLVDVMISPPVRSTLRVAIDRAYPPTSR